MVATRHILSTEFRNAFLDKIEVLLDERVLVGPGVTSREALRYSFPDSDFQTNHRRPLAYSMLADLIHHVRAELNYHQIRKTIVVYSNNLLDTTLSPSIQTMSAKLLLNMIDRIMKLPDQTSSRQVLMLILASFTNKITALNVSLHFSTEKQSNLDVPQLLREQGIQMSLPTTEQDLESMKGRAF